jgi:hypothetical protein
MREAFVSRSESIVTERGWTGMRGAIEGSGGMRLMGSIFAVLLLITGCAAGGYGRIVTDAEVTRLFTTQTVPEAYRYYQTGRSNLPYAIIGIAPNYRLVSVDWEPVEPNTEEFSRKVAFVWLPGRWDRLESPQGAWIVDAHGARVGIWYSYYPQTSVRVTPDRRVSIFSPFIPGLEP